MGPDCCKSVQEIRQKIADLERDVLSTEERIAQYSRAGYHGGVKKSLHQLESDLKYLSVLANGAPIDRDEDRRIMDFLRVHYNRLREYSLPMGR